MSSSKSIITKMRNVFALQTIKSSQPTQTQTTVEAGFFDPSRLLAKPQHFTSEDLVCLSETIRSLQDQLEELQDQLASHWLDTQS